MNTLAVDGTEVNPADLEAAYLAWLDAHADELADLAEAQERAENGWLL